MRHLFSMTAIAVVLAATSADARPRHVHSTGCSIGTMGSAARDANGSCIGATACVTSSAAGSFQAFVSALESTGYRIDFMGGWRRHGSCRSCDMHPRGLAIDINQTGRNRVTRGFPSGVTALAAQHGLLHGAIWAHADTGHFELMSASPTRYARRRTGPQSLPGAVVFAQSTTEQGSGYR